MKENTALMTQKTTPPEDDFTIRCPRLGHPIPPPPPPPPHPPIPCFKTLDCWFSHFKVDEFFAEKMDPKDFKKTFSKPSQPKVLSLMDLIEQAKKNTKKE